MWERYAISTNENMHINIYIMHLNIYSIVLSR